MNSNPLKDDVRPEDSHRPGTPTMKMIRDRAIQLAWVNGRRASDLKPLDYVEAKRDLMGETENDSRPAILESAPEPEPPGPVPGPAGEDEDDEGSSDNETPVETGNADAEPDRSVDSAKPAAKRDE